MSFKTKLVYISQGNIPCKWTHSIQMMKTAEAFAQTVTDFTLLTRGRIQDVFKSNQHIFDFYGIRNPFHIVRVPLTKTWNLEGGFKESYPAFMNLSLLYAKLHPRTIVYTRHSVVAYKACHWGLPTIMESHTGTDTGGFYFQKKIKNHPNLLGFVLSSRALLQEYLNAGFNPKKLLVQTNGVDLDFFNIQEEKSSLRKRLGLPLTGPIAVYTGHLFPFKGIDLILECAQQLPKIHFWIIGGTDQDIKNYRQKSAPIANIHFRGFTRPGDIAQYLAAADVCLIPNFSSTPLSYRSPLKMFEYCASRRPIVASGLPQFQEFLKDGHTAFVFTPDDLPSFKNAIQRSFENPSLSTQIVNHAYELARRHSWTNRVRSILNYYAPELLAEKKEFHGAS